MFVYSGSEVSDCGRYIILSIRQGCDPVNKLYYVDITSLKEGIKGVLFLFFCHFITVTEINLSFVCHNCL